MTIIAAWMAGIGTFVAGLNVAVLHLPVWFTAIGGIMIGIATVINGIYNGKNPDGSAKTPTQVIRQNQEAMATNPKKMK